MLKGLFGEHGILILIVILLLFGSSKIPDLARSLGKSINEFKKGREEGANSSAKDDQHPTTPPNKPA